jgi:hypothetical protein
MLKGHQRRARLHDILSQTVEKLDVNLRVFLNIHLKLVGLTGGKGIHVSRICQNVVHIWRANYELIKDEIFFFRLNFMADLQRKIFAILD